MLECFIAFVAVVADQLTKMWITGQLPAGASLTVIPGILDLRYVENTGAAFGMFGSATAVLAVFSAVIAVAMGFLIYKYRKTETLFFRISLSMILGGAIGNLIDRIALGYVVDFIEVKFVRFAVFNVADCFVTVGTILLAVYLIFMYDKNKKRRLEAAASSETKQGETQDK